MNNIGTTPNDILNWIKEKESGKNDNYNKCKEDTKEAIKVFDGLYGKTFATPYKLFEYLNSELSMRVSNEHQSFYRAFLVINQDEIISIRLAQHYSTKNSTRKGFRDNGKPDVEYHLIIDCHQQITPQNDIYFDRMFSNVSMKIRNFDLSDFNDGHIRRKILDEIIRLLTYGTATNENKQYNKNRKMKQTIRLNEADLHRIIKESVKKTLNELDWKTYMSAAQKRKAQGDYKKAGTLSDFANQRFGQQYDINNAEEHSGNSDSNFIHTGRTRVNFNGGRIGVNQYNNNGGERYHQKSVGQYQSDQDEIGDDFQGNTQNDYSKILRYYDEPRNTRSQRYFPMSNQFKNKLNTMTKDMTDFYSGNSKYEKGKGWQNESTKKKINRIVSECIRKYTH